MRVLPCGRLTLLHPAWLSPPPPPPPPFPIASASSAVLGSARHCSFSSVNPYSTSSFEFLCFLAVSHVCLCVCVCLCLCVGVCGRVWEGRKVRDGSVPGTSLPSPSRAQPLKADNTASAASLCLSVCVCVRGWTSTPPEELPMIGYPGPFDQPSTPQARRPLVLVNPATAMVTSPLPLCTPLPPLPHGLTAPLPDAHRRWGRASPPLGTPYAFFPPPPPLHVSSGTSFTLPLHDRQHPQDLRSTGDRAISAMPRHEANAYTTIKLNDVRLPPRPRPATRVICW